MYYCLLLLLAAVSSSPLFAELEAFKNLNLPQTSNLTSPKELNIPVLNVKKFPEIAFTERKGIELYVEGKLDEGFFKFGKVYLVFRKDELGYLHPAGRAVALENVRKNNKDMIKLVCYRFLNTLIPADKDKVAYLGEPMDDQERGDIKHILLSKINLDRELEDFYHGVMSFRFMIGQNSISGASNGDVNAFKKTEPFPMFGFGYTWWFFFFPQLGMDVEYRKGNNIKTISYFEKEERSELSNTALSLMFRMRLFKLPAMIHFKYFIDSFTTTNPDDFVIGSKYSGFSFFALWHFPYKFTLIPLGFAKMVFQDVELGMGFTPVINVKDEIYKRGASNSATSMRFHGGIFFNFESPHSDTLKDIFFGLVFDSISYSLNFSGPTEGGIPTGTVNTEKYFYWGFVIRYVFSDPFEDF